MKKYIGLVALIFLASCKSKSVLSEVKAGKTLTSEKIIESHYNNKKDFSTVYIKASARYKDESQTQNVTAEIKIKKDEKILVSIRFLGITMAKALITPSEVKYYEKLNGKYFEGDYTTLSQWLGTDLNFQKVQNLLIGQAMDDLTKDKYTTIIEDKMYKLSSTADKRNSKTFYFEAGRFLIKKQQIEQTYEDRMLKVAYPNHTQYAQAIMPTGILIEAFQKKGKTNISIEYNSVSFNEELSFPYSVPGDYERVFID